jgi:rubredoxin
MAMVSNPKGSPSSSKEYRCSICGRIFDSDETLNSHKRMDHGHEGNHTPAGVG